MKTKLVVLGALLVLVVAALSVPAGAAADCPATFVAPHAGVFYVQAYEATNTYELEAGEVLEFRVGKPGASWAVWEAEPIPGAVPWSTEQWQPGVLLADGVFECSGVGERHLSPVTVPAPESPLSALVPAPYRPVGVRVL